MYYGDLPIQVVDFEKTFLDDDCCDIFGSDPG